jgi:hypothetical protein
MSEPDERPEEPSPYLWDRSGEAEPDIADLEQALAPIRHRGELDWSRVEPPVSTAANPKKKRAVVVPLFGAALAIAAAFALYVAVTREPPPVAVETPPIASSSPSAAVTVAEAPRPTCSDRERVGFHYRSSSGAPQCDGGAAAKEGLVPKGAWLETDAVTRITLDVADIGHVDVSPGSRLRVVETSREEHRLELSRGKLHAKIDAPPRLFFVDTKAATAIDLGCEYEMEVDETGAGLLKVKLGYVELEPPQAVPANERRPPRLVPRGAECPIDAVNGPGTPVWSRSPESLRKDLASFDKSGDAEALARVIGQLGPKDTLTLFYIVASRAPEAERRAALDKLEAVQKAPAGVTRAATLALQRRAIQGWREALEPRWFPKEK